MKFKESLKLFWKENKKGYLWSCLGLVLLGLFLGVIGDKQMSSWLFGLLLGCPLILIMAYGVYAFTGGCK